MSMYFLFKRLLLDIFPLRKIKAETEKTIRAILILILFKLSLKLYATLNFRFICRYFEILSFSFGKFLSFRECLLLKVYFWSIVECTYLNKIFKMSVALLRTCRRKKFCLFHHHCSSYCENVLKS